MPSTSPRPKPCSRYGMKRARKALGLPLDARMIGALGRLVPIKGHTHLLQAFATLKDKYPEARCGIITRPRRSRPARRYRAPKPDLAVRTRWAFMKMAAKYVRGFDI